MNYRFLLSLFILVLLPGVIFPQSKTDWKLAKQKNGITVYLRLLPGNKFKEYKAITIVSTTPDKILRILEKPNKYPEWMSNIKTARLVKWEGDSVYYTWSQVAMPWPFHDRDQVSRSQIVKNSISGGILIKIRLLPGLVSHKNSMIRIKKGVGYWLLKSEPGGKTKIVFQFFTDLGTHLPGWLINMFIVKSPYQTLTGLKKMIQTNSF